MHDKEKRSRDVSYYVCSATGNCAWAETLTTGRHRESLVSRKQALREGSKGHFQLGRFLAAQWIIDLSWLSFLNGRSFARETTGWL